MRVINTLSARKADELKRRLAGRDLDTKPKPGRKTSRSSAANRAEVEQLRIQLLRSFR